MATDVGNTLIGAATVELAPWVTAAGAGTFADAGHHEGDIELSWATERAEFEGERSPGPERSVPFSHHATLKVTFKEMTHANLIAALGLTTTTNPTGTPPNTTVWDDGPIEKYHQIRVVGPGLGTNKVETITCWRCVPDGPPTKAIGKKGFQGLEVTFKVLADMSVAAGGSGRFFRSVYS